MTNWDNATPEQLKEESETILVGRSEANVGKQIHTEFEITLALSDNPVLLGFYNVLTMLYQNNLLNGWKQEHLASFMGLSLMTFNKYRDALIACKAIRFEKNEFDSKKKDIVFNYVETLIDDEKKRILKTHGFEQRIKVLQDLRTKVRLLSPDELKKQVDLVAKEQAQLFHDEEVKQEAKKIVENEKKKAKEKDQRFPAQDYISVISGYKKYKGVFIQSQSPDEMRVKKAIKQMFLSGHKVSEIIACMQFFNKYYQREGYDWMGHWTIETVMKKMPEFKAGKLRRPEIGDDIVPY